MGENISSDRIGHLVQTGLMALKNAMLINGAACVALLALIGHTASSGSTLSVSIFGLPLALFATGVFLAALASGTAYFGEGFGISGREETGMIWSLVTVGLVVVSLALFLFGALETYDALTQATR